MTDRFPGIPVREAGGFIFAVDCGCRIDELLGAPEWYNWRADGTVAVQGITLR